MQGDYGLWQCSLPCRQQTWSNEQAVREMVVRQANLRIPRELVPACPNCGAEAMMHLRIDGRFVEDEAWHAAAQRYRDFLAAHVAGRVVFLEVGVGWNTPALIKYPFWRWTLDNPQATCITLNQEVTIPSEIADRAIALPGDIASTLTDRSYRAIS